MSARLAGSRAVLAGLLSLFMVAGAFAGSTGTARADSAPLDPANPATPATVTADALPTVQVNGVVWSQAVVGTTVYAAGEFSTARPAGAAPGTQETVRNNLLAYDIRTGALIPSFAPDLNGSALAVTASPDGSRIYVGGTFNQANGQVRNRIAAYSTATGQLLADFRPNLTGTVYAIAATDSTVYVGGTFTAVGSQSRHRLAAFSTTGALLPWNPVPGTGPVINNDGKTATSDVVRALVVTGGGTQVVAAGHFDTLNGAKATGVGALDPVSGATRPFAVNKLLTNQGINGAVISLSTDGPNVYGTAYDFYGPGNLEGSFSVAAEGGAVNWINDCHGDTYSSHAMNGALYMAGHPHVCSNIGGYHEHNPRIHRYGTAVSLAAVGTVGSGTLCNSRIAPDGSVRSKSDGSYPCSGTLLRGKPAPALQNWFPTMTPGSYTGQGQAGWSVTGNGEYVVYGGEFPRVNGVGQQGLVRYAVTSTAPNKVGPLASLNPTVISPQGGMARITWSSTSDQDNENLTYRVYRDGNSTTPVYEVTRSSRFWAPQAMGFVDIGVPAGAHTYRVSASDALGNRVNSGWVSVDVAQGTVVARAYADAVRADGAQSYWPLGETTGATAYDWAGGSDMLVRAGLSGALPVQGRDGAVADDTAYGFRGTSAQNSSLGHLSTQAVTPAPNTFTVEAWFRTTSSAGGKIVGFGDSATGNSSNYDRHVYINTSGKVLFGVWPGAERIVSTSASYNDGDWHHVAASLSPAGMALYVDGELAGSRTDTTTGQSYNGYWRIGGDSSWTGARYFTGDIDEVAVYPVALTADRIADHFSIGSTGEAINVAPTAAFAASATHLTAAFDGTGSADADGTVASHAWDFGNGTTGTGAKVSHTYATAGTYQVTLTVTDDDGATGTVTKPVTVTAPPANVAPTAAFSAVASELSVAVDGSASADTDGTVASFAWDFGNGQTGTGATASHTYAKAGTYTVTLTVTDDDGVTGTSKQSVTVTEPSGQPAALATDAFGRQVAGGWGSADVGGAWTMSGTAANASVKDGAGQLVGAAGRTMRAVLAGVSHQDVVVQADVVLPEATTGGGTFVSLGTQRVGTSSYHGTLGVRADGSMFVRLDRVVNGADTALVAKELSFRHAPGQAVTVRLETSGAGTGTTTLKVKAWATGTAEPAEWTLTRTDTTAALQRPGGLLVETYTSGSSTRPSTVRLDNLRADAAGTVVTPPANVKPTAAFTAAATEMSVAVDGSASADTDGTVASFAWDFGNGQTGTGAKASHTYAAAGTYTVRLTVTDDDGATGTTTQQVTAIAPAPNQEPSAAFSAAVSGLSVAVDGSASADTDGTVASFAWDFGNGQTGTGAKASHTYAAAGTYTVTLTVTDDDGATATTTQSVTTTDVPDNAEPTAAFSTAVSGLSVAVDGSASADTDGTLASVAWDFGDGQTGTGAKASHTYAAAGTYTVTLTVTDDDGATATATQPVTVSTAPTALAADAFGRDIAGGWGSADVGGAWTMSGTAANTSVTGGAGQLIGAAGRTMRAVLAGVSRQDVVVQADVVLPEATTGGGTFVSLGTQRVGTNDYHGTLGVRADGSMFVRLDRTVNGAETTLVAKALSFRHAPGQAVTVRVETSGAGTGTTTLKVKAWAAGTAEPVDWTLTRTDTTAALQAPGGLLVETYTSGTSTRPSTVRLDNLWAGVAGEVPPKP